jgi:hypothetical protein
MSIVNEMSIQNTLDRKMSICVKKSIILDDLYSVENMRGLPDDIADDSLMTL